MAGRIFRQVARQLERKRKEKLMKFDHERVNSFFDRLKKKFKNMSPKRLNYLWKNRLFSDIPAGGQ